MGDENNSFIGAGLLFVILIIVGLLFYYYVVPAILLFFNSVSQFILSVQFLVGAIFGIIIIVVVVTAIYSVLNS